MRTFMQKACYSFFGLTLLKAPLIDKTQATLFLGTLKKPRKNVAHFHNFLVRQLRRKPAETRMNWS